MADISVALAFSGLLFLTASYGRIPWIALLLAFTLGAYGLLRKIATAESTIGLLIEQAVLVPLC